jgi:hypothetical protein
LNWDIPCPDNKVAGINYSWHLGNAKAALKKRGVADVDTWKPIFLRETSINEEGLYLVRPDAMSKAKAQHKHADVAEADLQLIHADKGLLDCAHYLSVALTRGGITVNTDSAPQLQTLIQSRSDTKTLAKLTDALNAKRILESGIIGDGDLIFYGHNGSIHHSAILLDQTKITCHTLSRHPDTWSHAFDIGSAQGWRYTIVHFTTDKDPALSGVRVTQLPGWWTVRFEGRDYYYYFDHPSGRVIWTLKKPASAKAKVIDVQGRGYWFDMGGVITIFWGSSGNMEKLTLGIDGSTLSGSHNDSAGVISGNKLL